MKLGNLIRNLSIKWKLSLLLIILLAVIGNTVTAYIVYSLQKSLKREFFMKAEVLGKTVAETIAEPILLNDVITADEILRECAKRPWVSYCVVEDKDGKITAHSFDTQPPADVLKSNRSTFLYSPIYGELWEMPFPILEGEGGTLFIGLPWAPLRKTITEYVRNSIVIGLLFSLGIIGLSYIIARRFVTPITGLTEMTREVALMKTGKTIPIKGPPCWEIMKCEKSDCPSFGDRSIPCWLRSGTLCLGKPVGMFAEKLKDCHKCPVYKVHHGDEISEMIHNFNLMSLTLKRNEDDIKGHIKKIEDLNHDLMKSNTKLSTLLDASRLTTSTLELEQILSTSLKIILDVTNLKTGIILLLEEDPTKRCYEFFHCDAYNCPAYKAGMNCWRLSGTMCHGEASLCPYSATAIECWGDRHIHSHYIAANDYDEKIKSCSSCGFFADIVLIPKMSAGFKNGGHLEKRLKLDSSAIHKALFMGQTIVDYSKENPFNLPHETATELAIPLKVQEEMIGILYLASDIALHYNKDEIEFFQLLSEIISSGIFNSRIFEDVETSYLQTVKALANAIEAKDPYTKGHTERVADLSMKIAYAFNLSKQEREHLKFAAILHDVGKIGISREILWKHCSLDECEEDEIRSHPDKGVQILEPVHFLKPIISTIRHHHEKFDGTGYPLGLKGKEIPFKARIISVVDAWDAMLSNRPYRDALSIDAAKEELKRHAGTQFDPEVVDVLIRAMGSE